MTAMNMMMMAVVIVIGFLYLYCFTALCFGEGWFRIWLVHGSAWCDFCCSGLLTSRDFGIGGLGLGFRVSVGGFGSGLVSLLAARVSAVSGPKASNICMCA